MGSAFRQFKVSGVDKIFFDSWFFNVTSVKTSNYVAQVYDLVRCAPAAAGFSVILPDAADAGADGAVIVKKTNSAAQTITVVPSSGDTVDGGATLTLNDTAADLASAIFVSDGVSNWMAIRGGGGGAALSDDVPQAVGVASAGTGTEASRDDHVHAHGDQSGGTLHSAASGAAAGFMSAANFTKLDNLVGEVVLLPELAQFLASAFPQYRKTDGTNFPVTNLAFDDTTNEDAFWKIGRVDAYAAATALTVRIQWYAAATTGNVVWGVAVSALTPGASDDVLTKNFDTPAATASAANGTTNCLSEATVTIPVADVDDLADGDELVIRIRRVANSGSDTMVGDAFLISAAVYWTRD